MTAIVASPDPVYEREDVYEALVRRDDGLARLVARYGTPVPFFWGVLEDAAERVLDGRLSFERLAAGDDATAQVELEQVRGVGPWSAQMFMLHNLRRPDVFPAADVGLQRAAQSAFALARRPTAEELAERAERWRPFRSYAAALLWAHGTQHPHQGA